MRSWSIALLSFCPSALLPFWPKPRTRTRTIFDLDTRGSRACNLHTNRPAEGRGALPGQPGEHRIQPSRHPNAPLSNLAIHLAGNLRNLQRRRYLERLPARDPNTRALSAGLVRPAASATFRHTLFAARIA